MSTLSGDRGQVAGDSMRKRKGAKLGQHFLKHSWAAAKLAHAVPLKEGEVFLEIGTGKGVLTRELLKLGSVVAIEKDEELVLFLQETLAEGIATGRLCLIEQDIRDFDPATCNLLPATYIVAANIPYYITGEIIRQFLTAEHQPRAMALLVQKEVADRIVARDGKESILSISVKAYGTPRVVAKVGKSHFSPRPQVDSAILVIGNISKDFFTDISEEEFFSVVKAGFASKRKMLVSNLGSRLQMAGGREKLVACGIDEKARAENVTSDQWKCLAKLLSARAAHND